MPNDGKILKTEKNNHETNGQCPKSTISPRGEPTKVSTVHKNGTYRRYLPDIVTSQIDQHDMLRTLFFII